MPATYGLPLGGPIRYDWSSVFRLEHRSLRIPTPIGAQLLVLQSKDTDP